jgi:hypothetical protein
MSLFGSIGKFLKNAAKTAGKPLHSGLHALAKATGEVTKAVSKVPFVGPALHATFDAALSGPFQLADSVASGRRVDKALLDNLKHQAADVKEVAPYAQMVISVIPVAGQGVSGVIGASLSMAEGHNITEAMKDGIIDAVPGGPIAKSVANIGLGVMHGDRIDKIALAAIPIPDAQKQMLGSALSIVNDVANKRNVSSDLVNGILKNIPGGGQAVIDIAKKNGIPVAVAAAEAALKTLPPQLHDAVKIGAAVGHAKKLQTLAANATIDALPQLEKLGLDHVKATADLQPLVKTLADPSGFYIGSALMQRQGVGISTLTKIRDGLSAIQKKGFDLALAAHIGKVTAPQRDGTPAQLAGYYATRGMLGASRAQRKGMLKTVTSNPDMKKGATVAAAELQEEGLWPKVLRYFGLKSAKAA